MKLLVPAFLLLALGYLSTAEVVESFEGKCDNFFFNGSPPTGPSDSQYKKICQKKTEADGYQFATLYDTSKRIPVYSAYKFQKHAICNRTATWDIEPQLDDQNAGALMVHERDFGNEAKGIKQALNRDYKNTDYDRGHLVPVLHQNSQQCVDATFTLTNAAPQWRSFNRGQWRVAERMAAHILTNYCLNYGFHAYVVTGVVPGNTKINDKVNVPSYFWSSFCCVDNNNVPHFSDGYFGNNSNNEVDYIPIAALNVMLGNDYGISGFQVFSDGCKPPPGSEALYRGMLVIKTIEQNTNEYNLLPETEKNTLYHAIIDSIAIRQSINGYNPSTGTEAIYRIISKLTKQRFSAKK